MFVNGFQWLPTTKHFLIQKHFSLFSFRACKYLVVFPPEEHQQTCPFRLKQVFLASCCCCKHRAIIWLCPRVRLPSSANSACLEGDGRIAICAVSYRSEKERGICSCFCLTPCPCTSLGQRQGGPYRRSLLLTPIKTDSKFLLNWDNNSYLDIYMWLSITLKPKSCLSTKLMPYFTDRIHHCRDSLKKGVKREKEMYF